MNLTVYQKGLYFFIKYNISLPIVFKKGLVLGSLAKSLCSISVGYINTLSSSPKLCNKNQTKLI